MPPRVKLTDPDVKNVWRDLFRSSAGRVAVKSLETIVLAPTAGLEGCALHEFLGRRNLALELIGLSEIEPNGPTERPGTDEPSGSGGNAADQRSVATRRRGPAGISAVDPLDIKF